MFKGINQFWVGLGLGCGLVATWVLLGPSSGSVADPSGSELVQDPAAPSWVSHARGLTMAGNREYALPLNNPDTVSAEQATHLKESDLVIGLSLYGKARAYPWWIMSNFHVVNDTLQVGQQSQLPLMVAMCEQCSGSAAFIPTIPELEDRPLTFQICGVHNGTFEIADFQSQSKWHPFAGEATEGPLKGRRLTQVGSTITSWKSWREKHPHTDVVLGSETLRQRPHGQSFGASMGHAHMHPVFGKSSNLEDQRLPSNTLVFGLLPEPGGQALAVPYDLIRSRVPLQIDGNGQPVVLLPSGDFGVRAYARQQEGQTLTFTRVSGSTFSLQDQDGNIWDEYGRCLLKDGQAPVAKAPQLKMLRGYLTEWYEWVSAQPESLVFAED